MMNWIDCDITAYKFIFISTPKLLEKF